MAQMCSITNTAHAIKRSLFRRRPLLLDRARSLSPVCCHVHMFTCCHVDKFSCLRVASLIDTWMKQSKLVIREGRRRNFYCGGVTRRHSFGKCVLTTLLKKYIRKKTPLSNEVLFISPIRDPDRLGF